MKVSAVIAGVLVPAAVSGFALPMHLFPRQGGLGGGVAVDTTTAAAGAAGAGAETTTALVGAGAAATTTTAAGAAGAGVATTSTTPLLGGALATTTSSTKTTAAAAAATTTTAAAAAATTTAAAAAGKLVTSMITTTNGVGVTITQATIFTQDSAQTDAYVAKSGAIGLGSATASTIPGATGTHSSAEGENSGTRGEVGWKLAALVGGAGMMVGAGLVF